MWGCHGVATWLTQANINVVQIYYFLVFNIKSIYVLCFHTYIYYKRTLVVFGFALVRWWLEKVFKPARNGFKYIYLQTVFRHLMFYDVYHIDFILFHTFFLTLFSTFRYSRLVSFIVILFIHWVRDLITPSFLLFSG